MPALELPTLYDCFLFLFRLILGIFFREIKVRGSHKIPKGPIIFAVAPHANQFIDPIVVMSFCSRPVSYLCAKKSFDRPLIGHIAKAFSAIPVVRPQDIKFTGTGKLFSTDGKEICGIGTEFKAQLGPRYLLALSNGTSIEVDCVVSDTVLKAKNSFKNVPDRLEDAVTFKVTPHVDQSEMFDGVYKVLQQGNAVGIFPEGRLRVPNYKGGSHDRPEFLPLKPGFAMMALGAMSKYPGLEVKIVPVGLNYFNRDKFRSRVVVEFGDPISITPEQVALYKNEKRKVVSGVMDDTLAILKTLTLQSRDFETLLMLQATRRLYRPSGKKLSLEDNLTLTRKFALGYEKFKDKDDIKELSKRVQDYNKLLTAFGIHDHQVAHLDREPSWIYKTLAWRIFVLVILLIPALPGFLLHVGPILFIRNYAAKKAIEAKNESSVKLEGKDVIGSWKLIVASVILPTYYTALSLFYSIYLWITGSNNILGKTSAFLFLILPTIAISTVKAYEKSGDIFKSIKPLLVAAMNKDTESLRVFRRELAESIQQIISVYGPMLDGISAQEFEQHRMIRTADFVKSNLQERRDGLFDLDLDLDGVAKADWEFSDGSPVKDSR